MTGAVAARRALAAAAGLLASSQIAAACSGSAEIREVRPLAVKAHVLATGKGVLSFAGYSGAEYEDPKAMLSHAERALASRRPADTFVNIGATTVGIGTVYELAKRMGFTTIGIVSTQARDAKAELSPCVDLVFYVPDAQWGGTLPGTDRLSPTSQAIVEVSEAYVAIGGGDVTRDEALALQRAGRPVTFIPADMNHRIASDKARKANRPEPADFQGSAHKALMPGR